MKVRSPLGPFYPRGTLEKFHSEFRAEFLPLSFAEINASTSSNLAEDPKDPNESKIDPFFVFLSICSSENENHCKHKEGFSYQLQP